MEWENFNERAKFMNFTFWQTMSNVLVLVGAIFAAIGTFGHYYFGTKIDAEKQNANDKAQIILQAEQQNQAEQLRRNQILSKLRQQYILGHDGISAEMMSGTAPLPKEWVEEQLKKMGEMWRQNQYY